MAYTKLSDFSENALEMCLGQPEGSYACYRSAWDVCDGEDGEEDSCLWLITFTDIMALMLTFFVLLYSMSSPNESEWARITSFMDGGMNSAESFTSLEREYAGSQDTIVIEKTAKAKGYDLGYIKVLFEDKVLAASATLKPSLKAFKTHIEVSYALKDVFDGGGDLTESVRESFRDLVPMMANIRNDVEVKIQFHGDGERAVRLNLERSRLISSSLMDMGFDKKYSIRSRSYPKKIFGFSLPEKLTFVIWSEAGAY